MDKLTVFLITVFLIIGLFVFNGYQAAKGKSGPITLILDNVGLKKLGSELGKPKIVFKDFQGDLEKLREQNSQTEEKRDALVARRIATIQELVKVNEQLKTEIENYLNQTYSEREAFLARYPELVEVGNYLATGPRNTDGTATRRMEVQLKIILGDIIRQLTNDPARLANTYSDLRQAVGVDSPLLAKVCPDRSLEQCFSENPKEIKEFFNEAIVALMIQPKRDFQAMKDSLQTLSREYTALLENYSASESQLKSKYGALDTRFQDMVKDLAVGQKIDMAGLTSSYKKFADDKKVITDNLQLNLERLKSAQQKTSKQMGALLIQIQASATQTVDNGSSAFQSSASLQATQEKLLVELEEGEKNMAALAVQAWDANKNFAGVLVETSRSYDQLSEETGSKTPTASAGKTGSGRTSSASPTATKSPSKISAPSARPAAGTGQDGSSRIQSSNEKMQRARDQARDQGFYK